MVAWLGWGVHGEKACDFCPWKLPPFWIFGDSWVLLKPRPGAKIAGQKRQLQLIAKGFLHLKQLTYTWGYLSNSLNIHILQCSKYMYKWYSGTWSWVANHSQAFKILLCSWGSLVSLPRCWCPPNLYVRHPLCPTTLWTMPEHLNPQGKENDGTPSSSKLENEILYTWLCVCPEEMIALPVLPNTWYQNGTQNLIQNLFNRHFIAFQKKSMRVVIPLWKSIKSIEGKPRGPRRSLVVPPESPRHSCPAKVW